MYSIFKWDYSNTGPSHSLPEVRRRVTVESKEQAGEYMRRWADEDPTSFYEIVEVLTDVQVGRQVQQLASIHPQGTPLAGKQEG